MKLSQQDSRPSRVLLGFFLILLFAFVLPGLLTFTLTDSVSGRSFGLPIVVEALFSAVSGSSPSQFIIFDWSIAIARLLLLPFVFLTATRIVGARIPWFEKMPNIFTVLGFTMATILLGACGYAVIRWVFGMLELQEGVGSLAEYSVEFSPPENRFPQLLLSWFIPICLVAPTYEESVFRGLLVNTSKSILPIYVVGSISTLVFTVAHFDSFGDLSRFVYLVMAGLLFFYARYVSGGIGLPILLHIIINFVSETVHWS